MQTIYDAKILIVDDNQDLLNLVTTALRSTGYNQLTACTGCAAAQAAFAANRPDLMILDINLPDGDGFTLFRTLHSMADIPALFLSARDADADRLFGLGLGADDYLTKPFLTQELLLRIQRILQRCYRGELWRTAAKTLQLGQRTVYLADALVRLPDGTAQPLTATERALLQKLAENRGHIVTYDAVCEAVWGADYYGYENSLNVHIRHLREKLEPNPSKPQYLLTVRGIGYKVGFKSNAVDATGYRVGALADALKQTETGLQWGREHTPAEWMQGYAWAMVLDDNGNVIWQQDLPQKLNHRYTASEVAVFSHWYLADYPVQCWAADYGLFVVAEPVGTCWKYNIDMKQKMIIMLAKSIQPTMVELLLVVLGCCLFFSWRGSKSLQTVTAGLDTLAQGGTVSLPAAGFAGELAQKLNETSEQLRRRNEIIARRDTARTEWIAGVSHDIRTPLALILGWAEQLQRDATLPAAARQKAGGICTQCEKIRSLIEDLNLTSKLQYGAQPLRRRSTQAGPFLRRVVAVFCENPLAARCTLDCSITPAVENAILHADAALLTRALENVLQNAVRHNAGPITLAFHADADETTLHLTIQDDGTGYPQSVLAVLNGEPEEENAPHILGLHVVEQIINAHGGSVQFVNRPPHGAKVMMQLPLAKDENEK